MRRSSGPRAGAKGAPRGFRSRFSPVRAAVLSAPPRETHLFPSPRLVCARPVTSRSAGQARVRLPPVRPRLFSPQPARRISARGLLPFMLPRSLFRLPCPPSFVHPCVPAPRLIPPRPACHASPARPCNPTAPHSVQAGARRFTPWPSPYADSAPGLIFFSLCARAPVQAVCARPLLCIHACPRPGSFPLRPGVRQPCALVRSAPAAPNSPKRPAAPLFSPADLCACRRAAYTPSPPDFLSAPGPLSYAPSSACPKRAVLYSGRAAAPLSAVFSPQKGRSGVLTVV